jgi:hypothetical protein
MHGFSAGSPYFMDIAELAEKLIATGCDYPLLVC